MKTKQERPIFLNPKTLELRSTLAPSISGKWVRFNLQCIRVTQRVAMATLWGIFAKRHGLSCRPCMRKSKAHFYSCALPSMTLWFSCPVDNENKANSWLDLVMHARNLSTWEIEAGESEEVMACLGYETLPLPRPDNEIRSVRWLRRERRELTSTQTTR